MPGKSAQRGEGAVSAVSFTGTAELTFADNEHLLVEADRVLVAMSDRGVGALSISHGGRPNVVDLLAAMEAGPFTLTYHGGMMSCRLLNFGVPGARGPRLGAGRGVRGRLALRVKLRTR